MSAPAGADVVRRLLEERRLQSVPADRVAAEALLEAAARHLDSSLVVTDCHPPPRTAFRPFSRLRTTHNRVEYDPVSPVDADDVRADHATATRLHAMAASLLSGLSEFSV